MKPTEGNYVKVNYEGTLENGEVFDSSEEKGPITFQVGQQKVLPGFEEAVQGLEEGEQTEITLEAEDAYGERKEEMKREFPKQILENLPKAEEGMQITMQDQQGRMVPGEILEIGDEQVKIDLNHPLAGKTLNFDITLEEVQEEPFEDHDDHDHEGHSH